MKTQMYLLSVRNAISVLMKSNELTIVKLNNSGLDTNVAMESVMIVLEST
jgi:hypothetical protein